jgi:hypothetical protein
MMEEILGKEALIQVRLFESSHIFGIICSGQEPQRVATDGCIV